MNTQKSKKTQQSQTEFDQWQNNELTQIDAKESPKKKVCTVNGEQLFLLQI